MYGICKKCEKYRHLNRCKMCSTCYANRHKVKHQLPNYGELAVDENGYYICHICGYAFKKPMSHVWQKHKVTSDQYKKQFGLNRIKGIITEDSRKVLRQRVQENYDLVVVDNLINNKNSKENRFTKGSRGRTRDKISAYEMNRLKKFNKTIKGDNHD